MKQLALIALLAATGFVSSTAVAQDATFEKEFVNRTIRGSWEPGPLAVSNDKPSVDASLGVFATGIFSRYQRVTGETRGQGDASAQPFTSQFK